MAPLLAFGPSLKVAPAPNMDRHHVTSHGAHSACRHHHHHHQGSKEGKVPNFLQFEGALAPYMDHHRVTSHVADGACLYHHHHHQRLWNTFWNKRGQSSRLLLVPHCTALFYFLGEIYSSVFIVPSLHVLLSFCAPRSQIPSDTSTVGGAIA